MEETINRSDVQTNPSHKEGDRLEDGFFRQRCSHTGKPLFSCAALAEKDGQGAKNA